MKSIKMGLIWLLAAIPAAVPAATESEWRQAGIQYRAERISAEAFAERIFRRLALCPDDSARLELLFAVVDSFDGTREDMSRYGALRPWLYTGFLELSRRHPEDLFFRVLRSYMSPENLSETGLAELARLTPEQVVSPELRRMVGALLWRNGQFTRGEVLLRSACRERPSFENRLAWMDFLVECGRAGEMDRTWVLESDPVRLLAFAVRGAAAGQYREVEAALKPLTFSDAKMRFRQNALRLFCFARTGAEEPAFRLLLSMDFSASDENPLVLEKSLLLQGLRSRERGEALEILYPGNRQLGYFWNNLPLDMLCRPEKRRVPLEGVLAFSRSAYLMQVYRQGDEVHREAIREYWRTRGLADAVFALDAAGDEEIAARLRPNVMAGKASDVELALFLMAHIQGEAPSSAEWAAIMKHPVGELWPLTACAVLRRMPKEVRAVTFGQLAGLPLNGRQVVSLASFWFHADNITVSATGLPDKLKAALGDFPQEQRWMFGRLGCSVLLKQKKYDEAVQWFADTRNLSQSFNRIYVNALTSGNRLENCVMTVAYGGEATQRLPGVGLGGQNLFPFKLTEEEQKQFNAAIQRSALSDFDKLYASCWFGDKARAKELLQKLVARFADGPENEVLQLISYASFLEEGVLCRRLCEALFRSPASSFSARDMAALFLLNNGAEMSAEALRPYAEYLLRWEPDCQSGVFQLLDQRGQTGLADQLRKEAKTSGAAESDREYLAHFADRFRTDPKGAEKRLWEVVENIVPALRIGNRSIFYRQSNLISSTLRRDDANRKVLAELLSQSKCEERPIAAALLYEEALDQPDKALALYRRATQLAPDDMLAWQRSFCCAVSAAPDTAATLFAQWRARPGFTPESILGDDDGRIRLAAVKLLLQSTPDEELTPMLFKQLRQSMERSCIGNNRGGDGKGSLSPLFQKAKYHEDEACAAQRRTLYRELAMRGSRVASLRTAAVDALVALTTLGEPFPAELHPAAVEVLRADWGKGNRLQDEFYAAWILGEYLNGGAAAWRSVVPSVPRFAPRFAIWEALSRAEPQVFGAELGKALANEDESLRAQYFADALRIAEARKLVFDPLALMRDGAVNAKAYQFPVNDLFRYLEATRSVAELAELLPRFDEFLNGGEQSTGYYYFSQYFIQNSHGKVTPKIAAAILRLQLTREAACEIQQLPSMPSLFRDENTKADFGEAVRGTSLLGTMAEFRMADGGVLQSGLAESVRTRFRAQWAALEKPAGVFGVELISLLLERRCHAQTLAQLLDAHAAEFLALPESKQVVLLKTLMRITQSQQLPLPREFKNPALQKSVAALNRQVLRAFVDDLIRDSDGKPGRVGESYHISARLFPKLAESDPETAEKLLLSLIRTEKKSRIQFSFTKWVNLNYPAYRLLKKHDVPFSFGPRQKSDLLRMLQKQYTTSAALPAMIQEFREVFPNQLNAGVMLLFLGDHPELIGDIELKKAFPANADAPELKMIGGFVHSRNRPPVPGVRAFMDGELEKLLAGSPDMNTANLERCFPEFFADPARTASLLRGRIVALNRRTGNKPEKAPHAYLLLLREGLRCRNRIPAPELAALLKPLAQNSLDTFPVLRKGDAAAVLPYLLEYADLANDREGLAALAKHEDIVTPAYARKVANDPALSPEAKAVFKRVFAKKMEGARP